MNTLHKTKSRRRAVACVAHGKLLLTALLSLLFAPLWSGAQSLSNANNDPLTTPDASGWLRTFHTSGAIDHDNPFFQSLGSNGRSCNSCHQQEDAWSITPSHLQTRFNASGGTDPVFRSVDGANSPLADVSTVAKRRSAYSMLLRRGVIRIGLPLPATAEFSLVAVDDPYHYASATELSLFRRPLPSTNLGFITGVMWDGRESAAPFLPPMDAGTDSADLFASLKHQATDAVLLHAQGAAAPSDQQLQQIIAFELGLSTAQIRDARAGFLNEDDALGGPRILSNQRFYVGINDALGADSTGAAFDSHSMSLFSAWGDDPSTNHAGNDRAAIARGENLFNTKTILITGVGGLNDALPFPTIVGTCTMCHDAPNVGNHTVTLPLNIGLTDASRRTPDMPLYTLRNNATGETVQTTDPGKALISGRWADIGKFKGPVLRGLAGRAPYFHNGFAASLDEVVDFYNTRFNIGLSAREKSDLVAFMRSL
jgi:cytochrome c peroxidase